MRSIAKNIHLSAVKQPTKKLFWPWFLPILAGNSYPKSSKTVGDVERGREPNYPVAVLTAGVAVSQYPFSGWGRMTLS